VEVVLDDAHNYLARTDERFDVVIADLFVPWRSGTGALFTREHFQNVRDRLEPGGLFCQWLPLYQLGGEELHVILATFLDVFPTAALFRGDFYGRFPIAAFVGWRDEPASAAAVEGAVARLAAAGETDRWVTDPGGFWSLYAGALGPLAPTLAEAPRNTEDRPVLEYLAARHQQGGDVGLAEPYVGVAWQRFVDGVRTASLLGDPLWPGLDARAKRAAAGGAALQMAGALWVEGRAGEAARAVAVAASLLPPHLLTEAPADPSAAELWPDPTPSP
jgi:spermidine synthase